MSEAPNPTPAPAPTGTPPATGAPAIGAPAATGEPATPPPWGDNFDASRAWHTITTLRDEVKGLKGSQLTEEQKTQLADYSKLVEASKTELEKAQEAAGKVPTLEAQNLRLQVALEKGLVGDKAGLAKRLQGSTLEELTADADELLAHFTPAAPTPPEPTAPKPNPALGSSGGQAPSAVQQAAEATAAGDWRKAISHKSDQLLALREITN